MALMQWPTELNGIPLSSRTQWLLFAPTWMMFPKPRKRLMGTPIRTIEQGLIDRLHYDPDTGMLYVLNRTGAWDRVRSVAARGLEGWVRP